RFYSAANRLNGVAELASIVERADELVGRSAGGAAPTVLLRGRSLGGDLVIGEGIAGSVIADALRGLRARRALLVSEPRAWAAARTLVGAFRPPAAVVIDIAFLRSLPERQRRAALGEAVKMAALGDERLFALLEGDGDAIARGDAAAFDSGAVAELVERAAWAKVQVTDADERE